MKAAARRSRGPEERQASYTTAIPRRVALPHSPPRRGPRLTRRRHDAALHLRHGAASAPRPAPARTIASAPRGRREGRRLLRGGLSPTGAAYGHQETVKQRRARGKGGMRAGSGRSGAGREAAAAVPLGGGSGTVPPGGGRGRPLARMWAALIGRAALGAQRVMAP